MKKPKILFDTQQLKEFNGHNRTGIYRVADEILKRLIQRNDIDLFFCIDEKPEIIKKYLRINDFNHTKKSIYMPYLKKTTRNRNFLISLKSNIYKFFLTKKYKKKITGFDWYFSPYDPISPIISDNIKTSIFIHDIIPITHPQYVAPKFTISYTKFIKNLKTNFIFFASQCSKDAFLKYRTDFPTINTAITPLAADQKFKSVTDLNASNKVKKKYNITSEKYFLSVSDLNPRKNIAFIIKNFINFIKTNKIKDLSLVLSGPSEEFSRDSINDFTKFSEYLDKIIITNFVDDADLPTLYSNALAFIYVPLFEGFGLPPLEAMQCGTPVITSNISSIPEVVGDAAILIDPTKDSELNNAMKQIYQDKTLRTELSSLGINQAKKFSWDNVVNKLVEVWKE